MRSAALGLFLLFQAVLPAMGQSFSWEQRASLPASGRWGAFHFEIDGKGYVAGGHNGSTFLNDVWRYDPDSDSWEQRASMPAGRRHGASWSMNGKGYVTCGQVTNTSFSNMLWEYDPQVDVWSVKASMPGEPRYGPYGFALNGRGFVGGGNYGSATGPYLGDMWRYDPATDQWSEVDGIPALPRYGSTSFVSSGKGYVHGGRDASLDFSNELWVFDPVTNSWTQAPTMPGPGRSWAMVMPFAFDAVVACGKDGADNNLHDAYWFYPVTDTWVPIPDYPGASGWSGVSFALGDRVFGGLGRTILPTNAHYNDFWELIKREETSLQEAQGKHGASLEVVPTCVVKGQPVRLSWTGVPGRVRARILVYDVSGRLVQEGEHWNGELFETGSLGSGQYLVHMESPRDGKARGRLVLLDL